MKHLSYKNASRAINVLAIAAIFMVMLAPVVGLTQANVDQYFGTEPGAGTKFEQARTFSQLAVKILNTLLAIVGLVAVVYLVIGAFKYITSTGEEEKLKAAKSSIINALIGVVLVLLAFALVRIVARATLGGEGGV